MTEPVLFHTNMTPYGEVQLRRARRLDLSDPARETGDLGKEE